ncbi:MAG TPA: GIY-YIG nuclease family protein, partial [Myxococcota bacterium]
MSDETHAPREPAPAPLPPERATRKETRDQRRQRIAERVRTLPTDPGCYLMKDRRGEIFYVGKASDLRSRVKSYFSGSDTRQFVDWLDDLLDDLDVIVVRNEKEALLLERTLVRQHQPRFNVKLRDDKNFIHLKLQTRPTTDPTAPLRRRYPRVEVVRGAHDDEPGVRIFGPYHSATAARATLRVLNRNFQLRTCRDSVIDNRVRPCLQHQIGRCPAPCVHSVPAYTEALQDTALFLAGRRSELGDRLRARMMELADKEDYEGAARVRDQVKAVGTALDDQAVTDVEKRSNQDIWGIERRGSLLVLVRVLVRDGRMQGIETHEFDRAEFPTDELVGSFLAQLYDDIDAQSIPEEVLLAVSIGEWD